MCIAATAFPTRTCFSSQFLFTRLLFARFKLYNYYKAVFPIDARSMSRREGQNGGMLGDGRA